MHRHDFVSCKCHAVSVDGGMSYLRRVGTNYIEQSIVLDDDLVEAMTKQADWAKDTGRNSLGYVCAIIRVIRDEGYEITKKEDK